VVGNSEVTPPRFPFNMSGLSANRKLITTARAGNLGLGSFTRLHLPQTSRGFLREPGMRRWREASGPRKVRSSSSATGR
jgi:hypothetical protein